jgi:hypothetical protein
LVCVYFQISSRSDTDMFFMIYFYLSSSPIGSSSLQTAMQKQIVPAPWDGSRSVEGKTFSLI